MAQMQPVMYVLVDARGRMCNGSAGGLQVDFVESVPPRLLKVLLYCKVNEPDCVKITMIILSVEPKLYSNQPLF